MTDNSYHAVLSPSSAHRWTACPGSVALTKDAPRTSSAYADEGTRAHEVAADVLRQFFNTGMLPVPSNEMEEAAMTYAENIKALLPNPFDTTKVQLLIEQKVPIGFMTGEKGATGTADAIVIAPTVAAKVGGAIQIHDFKYGKGVEVEAVGNLQLLMYAAGAVEVFGMLVPPPLISVEMFIHQPRLGNGPKVWRLSARAFEAEVKNLTLAAVEASAVLRGDADYRSLLRPGAEACKFCEAKATCPALYDYTEKAIGHEIPDLANTAAILVDDTTLEQRLVDVMTAADVIESLITAVRGEVYRRLEAGLPEDSLLAQHFKLVQGRRGVRQWSDEAEAEKTFKSMRLKQEEMYDMKLISPTTAEKVLKSTPKRWDRVKSLIVQPEGRPSVAPITDKRPALRPATAEIQDLTAGGLA